MIAVRETSISIQIKASLKTLQFLEDTFKFRPPDYWRAASYLVYKSSNGKRGWDGYMRPFKIKNGIGLMPRGWLSEFLVKCEANELKVDTSRLLASPFKELVSDDIPTGILNNDFEPDENQKICVVQWLRTKCGINKVTVSGGKTLCFLLAAALIKKRFPKTRFLYVTPTERLIRQVTREAKKMLPDWSISQFGGGEKNPNGKDIVVATSAMMTKNFNSLRRNGWFKSFQALLGDECHHFSSPSYEKIAMEVPAFFRLGASDSMKSDDIVKFNKIKGLFGEILHSVDAAPLIASGRIAVPNIYLVDIPEWKGLYDETPVTAAPETDAWAYIDDEWKKGVYTGPAWARDEKGEFKENKKGERIPIMGTHEILIDGIEHEIHSRWCLLDRLYDKAIIQFKARNNLICQWVKHFTSQDMPTLVVCTRTLHVLTLKAKLTRMLGDEKVRSLISDNSSKERDRTFDWLRATPGGVLITPLVKEGVSINEIKAGVVADYIADHEYANQIIGRFIRKKKDTHEAHVVWFIDQQHPTYRKGSRALFKKLRTIRGYNFYHPVSDPDSKEKALLYTGGS